MLAMAKVDSIRKAYFEEGRSVSEISRLLKADRKTVRKYLDKEDFNITPVPVKTRNSAAKLEPFKAVIDEWLEGDKSFKKKQRHTAKRVYDRLLKAVIAAGPHPRGGTGGLWRGRLLRERPQSHRQISQPCLSIQQRRLYAVMPRRESRMYA